MAEATSGADTKPVSSEGVVSFASGFHPPESDGFYTFRWMDLAGRVAFPPAGVPRFLGFRVLSEFKDLSQEIIIATGSRRTTFALRAGWTPLSVPIDAGVDSADLAVNKPYPKAFYPRDHRTLSVRVRNLRLHQDLSRHDCFVAIHANHVLNTREILEGRATLSSTPPVLGIDMHGACNVKPPCVYCEWDHNKRLEGDDVDTPFTRDTLREWGPIFENAASLVNCSIGEPFMMRNLDELLDAFDTAGKELELTTNGQILTERNIGRLLGRPVNLLISLDAAMPETYAKLRNDRFDSIIRNLEHLVEAKGGPGAYPLVQLVFMPMKVNLRELPAFIELAARLQVDRVILRPLNYAPQAVLNWERAGYRFEYANELLPFDELVRASGRAFELCRRAGVRLIDQMDFGGSMDGQFHDRFEEGRRSAVPAAEPAPSDSPRAEVGAAPASSAPSAPLPSLGDESIPLCTEPWQSMYILRRGVIPCGYGKEPIAKMGGFRGAWNSPLLQDIRRDLAAGTLHPYCLESTSCPIVRKAMVAGEVQPPAPPEPASVPADALARRIRRRAASAWRRLVDTVRPAD
jgi:MoaA/NifB/PqqE/SkfB family radical SAM enzyme